MLGGRIAHRLDAASLLHCNPKCVLIPDPIGSPTFPSLKLESRRSRLPRGPFKGSKIPSRMLVELVAEGLACWTMPTFPLCPQSDGQEGGFWFVTRNPNLPPFKVSYAMLVARKGKSILGRMVNMVLVL